MNLPNKITICRLIAVIIIDILLLIPWHKFFSIPSIPVLNIDVIFLIVLLLFLLASISDYLDGHIARKYNLVTNFGKFMDPIADKLLINSVFIILTQVGPIKVPVVIPVIMISRDIIVDVLRMLAMEQKQVLAANIFGKVKTVLQMVAIIFVLLNDFPFSLLNLKYPIALIICYLAMISSIISGIIYIIQNRKILKETK